MTHTPGPWEVDMPSSDQYDAAWTACNEREELPFDASCAKISGKKWAGFANVCVICQGTPDAEGEANARLIAASPDLLAACKAYLASLSIGVTDIAEHGVRSPRFASRADDMTAALRDMKAAVAKAEGRTP